MSFRQKKASEDGFSLYAEKKENVKNFKYLGIILDQRLNFFEHSNIIQKKLNRLLNCYVLSAEEIPKSIANDKSL